MSGNFEIEFATILIIIIGQMGHYRAGSGGTFVIKELNEKFYPLIVAGGAGGNFYEFYDFEKRTDGSTVKLLKRALKSSTIKFFFKHWILRDTKYSLTFYFWRRCKTQTTHKQNKCLTSPYGMPRHVTRCFI